MIDLLKCYAYSLKDKYLDSIDDRETAYMLLESLQEGVGQYNKALIGMLYNGYCDKVDEYNSNKFWWQKSLTKYSLEDIEKMVANSN